MGSESDPVGGSVRPAVSVADAAWAERLALLQFGLIGGSLLSLIGFAVPWFRISRSYRWWYGGWELLTTNRPDLAWIALIVIAYALIVLAGYFVKRFGIAETITLAAATIGVACGTLIVVALAAADAVNEQGRVYRLDFNLGLLLMVVGHGAMIASAVAAIVVQAIRAALNDFAATGRD